MKIKERLKPLKFRNNVGQELFDVLECNGIKNPEEFSGIKKLKKREIITKRQLISIGKKLSIPEITDYLMRFQKDYFQEKAKYEKRRNFLNRLF